MSTPDGTGPHGGRRAVVSEQEDAVVARLQQLAADLDDAPDARFRAATRDRLVAMAAVRTPRPAPRSGLRRLLAGRAGHGPPAAWHTRLTAGLAGAALTVTALATLVALATDARPGDVLYGVKRGTEQTQLALAGDDRGLTLLQFAETRLAELAALRDPAVGDVVDLLDTMDAQTRQGVALLTTRAVAGRDTAPLSVLTDWAGQQSAELSALQAELPAGTAPASQGSLGVLADVSGRAAGLQAALACPEGPATAGTDPFGPVPGECPTGTARSGTSTADDRTGDTGGGRVGPEDAPASGGVGSGDAPASGGVGSGDAPASDGGTPAGTATDSPAPAPEPEPAPAPSAPATGSGDRDGGSSGEDGGRTAPVPEPPAVESPLPELPVPTPTVPAEPDDEAPLLDTPLPVCIPPLVC